MKNTSSETKIIYQRLNPKENNFFNNKKILLLGSDGFIGKAFVNYFSYLIEKGKKLQIDCVDNNISSSRFKRSQIGSIKFYHADVMKFNIKKNMI